MSEKKTSEIILQGGGDHARVVLDCLQDNGIKVVGIFDPKYSGELFGVSQCGKYDPSLFPDALCIVAIGDNRTRKKVADETRHAFSLVAHKTAIVSLRATVGEGSMVLHRAVIQANATVGRHVIVNTAAQVDHDCAIGDFVHLAPGTILCGSVLVGEGAFVGAGAVVIPGKKIGQWATIGAGTVVRDDVPDYAVVVGNPGRVIRNQNP